MNTSLHRHLRFAAAALACLVLAACAQNPVTGERHLQFYGEDWEKEVGSGLYQPMRQSQGGDFLLDPELTAYVQSVGERVARQARRADSLNYEFHIVNDSTPNAWALPGGKIALHRGLLTKLESEAELAAVIGHEIVHADAAHAARQQSTGMLAQIGALAGMILINSKVDSTQGREAAAMIPALGAQLISQKYSRDAELESDHYGMIYMSEAGYDPQGAVALQETFLKLSEGRPDDWLSGLFASHPPSRERLEQNRETAAALPPGGERGAADYRARMARLERLQPAYEAYDEALKAANEGNERAARNALDRALRLAPEESLFHALDGDLKRRAGRDRSALAAYDRAVELYPDFFYHRMRRGSALFDQRRWRDARTDLELSVELLPTAQAHYLLGRLDREAGNRDAAVYHFRQAARADSDVGRSAERELVVLDIASNPGQYVAVGQAADDSGRVFCLVGNRTRLVLEDVQVRARFMDDRGQVREGAGRLREVLAAGEQGAVAMGWNTADPSNLARRMECVVSAARVAD